MGQGVFKQKNGLWAVDVVGSCGVLTPEQLAGLARLAEEAGAIAFKLTSRQTLVALLPEGRAAGFMEGLAALGLRVSPYGNVVRAVKACPGNEDFCPRALGDALGLGMALQERYLGREVPKDFKIAVAGCPRGCVDPYCADFGVIAAGKDVFDVAVGGMGGSSRPRHGVVVARRIGREKVFALLEHVLARFGELAQPREKLGRAIERLGVEPFLPPAPALAPEEDGSLAEFARFLKEHD